MRLEVVVVIVLIAGVGYVRAADPGQGIAVENDWLRVRLIPRTPQQVAAFYEARGFPSAAVGAVREACFLTVGMRNKSNTVVWLELKNWRATAGDKPIKRLDRAYWNQRWEQLRVPQAKRSTFGWTLLPEVRDLQPSEPVGGNITLPRTEQPFTLEAVFVTQADRRGEALVLTFNNVRCAASEPGP